MSIHPTDHIKKPELENLRDNHLSALAQLQKHGTKSGPQIFLYCAQNSIQHHAD